MSPSFDYTLFEPPIPVTGLTTITAQDLVDWVPFKEWATSLKQALKLRNKNEQSHILKKDFKLKEIKIQGVDMFGQNEDIIGFVKLEAKIEPFLPGITLLRGGSVAILMILHPPKEDKSEPQVVFVIQPRIPAGSLAFQKIPAGMLDGGKAAGKVLDEVQEEVGIIIKQEDLDNLTELATSQSSNHWWSKTAPAEGAEDELLHAANYPSVGGCDEAVTLYLWQARVSKVDMNALEGKETGVRKEGESIVTKLVPLKDVWKEGARDGKTMAALALYQNLKAADDAVAADDRKLKPLGDATVRLELTK